ncbi:MAG TPA: hypothetical protein VNK26_04220, partial [Pyrinomonadaceae bacterium]|nr:hypothetical protein [Pyrinomonadaceae bacterium]
MFSFLTKPHLPSNSIGLEKDFVTAVSIEGSRQNFRINRAATVDLPAGLINPSFTEKNISSQANLRVYIEEAIGAAGLLDKKRWSVSLPASSCRSSLLTVENDPSLKKKLEEVLDWKAEQSFGVPARQMRISWYSLGTDTQGKARYFASAIRLEVLEEYEALFEGMGLNAGLIITKPVAEASWLADKLGDRLLISEQSDGFTGILMRAGTPSFIRNVNCSAEQIYDEIYRLLLFYS